MYKLWHAQQVTGRFGVMAAVDRRKCSANLEVCRLQEVLWKPPLRQAAGTLAVMRRERSGRNEASRMKVQIDSETK
jgi:hypothetical protein